MRRRVAVLVALAGACGPTQRTGGAPAADRAPHLVLAERGPAGGRLVVVDESGDRRADLTRSAGEVVRDASPVFSPDGRWIAFVSSRGRALDESSLWVVAARPGAEPVRLTEGPGIDVTPAWTPDGRAIVYASNAEGGLDLWRLDLVIDGEAIAPAGAPERLTELPGEELTPSVAADGRIAFTRIDRHGAAATSRIAVRAPDGRIEALTSGPADSGPAWTPDGTAVAFTAPSVRAPTEEGEPPRIDGDLWLVSAAGGEPTLLVDAPETNETGPVWSADGRWIFATSIYLSAETGAPLFSSVVYVDRWEQAPTVRMLVDRAGAVPRLAVAVAPVTLDASALHAGPPYRDELAGILRRALDARAAEP